MNDILSNLSAPRVVLPYTYSLLHDFFDLLLEVGLVNDAPLGEPLLRVSVEAHATQHAPAHGLV